MPKPLLLSDLLADYMSISEKVQESILNTTLPKSLDEFAEMLTKAMMEAQEIALRGENEDEIVIGCEELTVKNALLLGFFIGRKTISMSNFDPLLDKEEDKPTADNVISFNEAKAYILSRRKTRDAHL